VETDWFEDVIYLFQLFLFAFPSCCDHATKLIDPFKFIYPVYSRCLLSIIMYLYGSFFQIGSRWRLKVGYEEMQKKELELSKLPSRISIDQIQVPVHLPGKEALEVTPNITFWQKLISGEITLKDCPEWAIQVCTLKRMIIKLLEVTLIWIFDSYLHFASRCFSRVSIEIF